MPTAAPACPQCFAPAGGDVHSCAACRTPYHRACWNGMCLVAGCQTAPPPPVAPRRWLRLWVRFSFDLLFAVAVVELFRSDRQVHFLGWELTRDLLHACLLSLAPAMFVCGCVELSTGAGRGRQLSHTAGLLMSSSAISVRVLGGTGVSGNIAFEGVVFGCWLVAAVLLLVALAVDDEKAQAWMYGAIWVIAFLFTMGRSSYD